MTLELDSRILNWEGCFNVRDLGGLPAAEGRRVRHGAVVRSDILTRLTAAGQSALVAHGVRTIVDLRFADEVATDGNSYPFGSSQTPRSGSDVRYSNVPLNIDRDPARSEELHAAYRSAPNRAAINRLDLDWSQTGVATALAAVADAEPGGVLVHCHAGKDRTGIVVALALSLAGVSDEDIADDYALTMLSLEPLIVEWLDSIATDETERARLRSLAMPTREAMLDTLGYVRATHGSAESYLRGGGMTSDQIGRLKDRLLDEGHAGG